MTEVDVAEKKELPFISKILLFGVLPAMTAALVVIVTLYISGVFPGNNDLVDYGDGSNGSTLPAVYLPIKPTFVVNFAGQGNARFLQITVEVMSRSPDVLEQVGIHIPVIRNNLNMLFSDQQYDNISTLEGKETLREKALKVIQRILEEETGNPGIEAVYFTSFVMQ